MAMVALVVWLAAIKLKGTLPHGTAVNPIHTRGPGQISILYPPVDFYEKAYSSAAVTSTTGLPILSGMQFTPSI